MQGLREWISSLPEKQPWSAARGLAMRWALCVSASRTGIVNLFLNPLEYPVKPATQFAATAVSNTVVGLAPTSTSSAPKRLEQAWILALFKRMEAIYSQKWAAQFASESVLQAAMDEWALGLFGLTGRQIKRGIDCCRVGCTWPPSIAEFVRFARAVDECWQHRGPAYQLHVRALPKPKANAIVVRSNLSAMRKALGHV